MKERIVAEINILLRKIQENLEDLSIYALEISSS